MLKREKAAPATKKQKSKRFARMLDTIRVNSASKRLFRHFEWPLAILVLILSLYGVLAIFAATGSPLTNAEDMTLIQKIRSQSFTYPRLQLIWMAIGGVAMMACVFFDYHLYGQLKNVFYWGNVIMLLIVLGMEKGRGAATMFYRWGDGRTFQPAELGKLCIIIALARLFADREKPIRTVGELIRVTCYLALPLVLIVLQPDVGTALVYIALFAGLIFASGTDLKIILGVICIGIVILVPAWYILSTSSSFRVERIQVWLDPNYDILGAGMQTYNGRLAVGSGGLWGKGLFSAGNFAALNYIPDDHTDFIFAIVCETFGFVGGGLMILLFLLLILRMIVLSSQAQDAFGSYIIVGVASMILFHTFENISMVIGLMPVTGIPLPFVSYGGSNYLTNIIGVGLVINVAMRSRAHTLRTPSPQRTARPAKL